MTLTSREALARAEDMMCSERLRQVSGEGYSDAHDDAHTDGSLLSAGLVYLYWRTDAEPPIEADGRPKGWLWELSSFKPKDRERNLVRAGALIIAESQRLHRAGFPVEDCRRWFKTAIGDLAALLQEREAQ